MLYSSGPCASNYDVVGPEAEREEEKGDVNGMAVQGPRGDGDHDGPQHRVDGQGGHDQQPVHPVDCCELVHQGLQLARGHLGQEFQNGRCLLNRNVLCNKTSFITQKPFYQGKLPQIKKNLFKSSLHRTSSK